MGDHSVSLERAVINAYANDGKIDDAEKKVFERYFWIDDVRKAEQVARAAQDGVINERDDLSALTASDASYLRRLVGDRPSRQVVQNAIASLQLPEIERQKAAIRLLPAQGERAQAAVPHLVRKLGDPQLRETIHELLLKLDPVKTGKALIATLEDPGTPPGLRREVAIVLGEISAVQGPESEGEKYAQREMPPIRTRKDVETVRRSRQPTIVFYTAPSFCGPCRRFSPVIAERAVALKGRVNFRTCDTGDETNRFGHGGWLQGMGGRVGSGTPKVFLVMDGRVRDQFDYYNLKALDKLLQRALARS